MTTDIESKAMEQLIPDQFDEAYYLDANPDVKEAVLRGDWSNGKTHWEAFGRAEGRRAVPPGGKNLEALAESNTTDLVMIEMTSRCNLRCVYCAVSQPTYVGIDLAMDGFDNFVEQMKERRVSLVNMNGHGESTIIRNWEAYADRLADEGFRLHITTNLAKPLKPEEVAAFSRFERILVSIDTIDADLLAKLRRGANLQRILGNIEAILEFAAMRKRDPGLAVSFTVGDLSAPGVEELVDTLLEIGVRTFRFGDLVEMDELPTEVRMRHVSRMPEEAAADVRAKFERALAKIEAAGAISEVDASLRSWLAQKSDTPSAAVANEVQAEVGKKTVWAENPTKGKTRDCLDPWNLAFVRADATVRPCCFFDESLGSLAEDTLDEVVRGEEFRKLREELLTGAMRPNCATCQARSLIDLPSFHEKVSQLP